jgi:hypothetical protein
MKVRSFGNVKGHTVRLTILESFAGSTLVDIVGGGIERVCEDYLSVFYPPTPPQLCSGMTIINGR